MTSLTRAGALAAIVQSLSYIVGFAMFFAVLDRSGYEGPAGELAFVVANAGAMAAAMIVLYIIFGIALVVLAIALHFILAPRAPHATPIATAFGLIWAGLVLASGMVGLAGMEIIGQLNQSDPQLAATAWAAIGAVQNGLGGGIEVVGGVWTGLVSWIAWRAAAWSRTLNGLGLAIGAIGIATVLPGAGDLVSAFGLAQIVWFLWLGVALLRRSRVGEALHG